MSRIAYLAAGAVTAERNRNRMARTGRTPAGHSIWTDDEEALLRHHHRDYQAAIRALAGRRSYYAVRAKAQALGLATKRNHWTGDQVVRPRRLFRCGTTAEIRAAFPGRSRNNIYKMAAYFGIKRPRKPFTPTGVPIIDQIRAKCFECALSMVDLDDMARTGNYFARAGWASGHVKMSAVAKAVKALGGVLAVRWDDPPDDVPVVSPMPRLMPGGRLSPTGRVPIAA